MQLTTSIVLVFCALGLQGALATPVLAEPRDVGPHDNITELFRRVGTGNSPNDPIEAELHLDGIQKNILPFEADCYAILCLGAPDVLQRVDAITNKKNRMKSGVCNAPFKEEGLKKYGISLPKIDDKWGGGKPNSPEEYPFASSSQGGSQAYLIPVTLDSQRSQGGALSGFLKKNNIMQFNPSSTSPRASDGTWYRIKYTGNMGPYCEALSRGDTSVCKDGFDGKGPWGFDVANHIYKFDGAAKAYHLVPRR